MKTLVVVGLGLMGGSIAAAAKSKGICERIIGIDPSTAACDAVLDMETVDEIVADVPGDAELIVLCMPSDLVADAVIGLRDHPGTVLDIGSVKGHVVRGVVDSLGRTPSRFVPCHPVAGSEKSGAEHSNAQLFEDRTVVLTPVEHTDPVAIVTASGFWESLGARCVQLTPEMHDKMLATTSHLPHLLAFAFMQGVAEEHLEFAGGGFRDFTRIAAANPELWWRILQLNREELLQAAERFVTDLEEMLKLVDQGDADAGRQRIEAAVALRAKLED